MADKYAVVVSCEHGGNLVPEGYASLFEGKHKLLESHRGYDAGALELSRKLSSSLGCPLYQSQVTRLLVDLNRSPDNPRRFSDMVRKMEADDKERIDMFYYRPYRKAVEGSVEGLVRTGTMVLHISVHSFGSTLGGRKRQADIGLLYDPKRKPESEFCSRWRKAFLSIDGSLRIRRNYPYLGTSDGLTSFLRRLYREDEYLGIELEVNQSYTVKRRDVWLRFMRVITLSLKNALKESD